MHTDEPREVEGIELGYDPRDIDLPKIGKIVVYFFVFAIVFFGGGAIVFTHYDWGARTAFDNRKPEIVGPKVQGNISAKVDIMQMRQDERRAMETYGNEKGVQRIPVDRAIELLAQRGLPPVTSDEKAVSRGNTIPQNAKSPAEGGTVPNDPNAPLKSDPVPASSTTTSPATTPPVPTPDAGGGATGSTGGASAP